MNQSFVYVLRGTRHVQYTEDYYTWDIGAYFEKEQAEACRDVLITAWQNKDWKTVKIFDPESEADYGTTSYTIAEIPLKMFGIR